MADCFLKGYGTCTAKISKEHYISKTILKALSSNGSFQIGGLPWQPDQTLDRSLLTRSLPHHSKQSEFSISVDED